MSKLGGLIQGQDLAFDTHESGVREVHWEQLHLEKRLHEGGKARYHLFGGREASSSGINQDRLDRVTREVRRALGKNPKLTQDLARLIAAEINRWSRGEATLEHAQEAARKIAGYFDLDERFVESVARFSKERLVQFVSQHKSLLEPSRLIEIRQSPKGIVIRSARDFYRVKLRSDD